MSLSRLVLLLTACALAASCTGNTTTTVTITLRIDEEALRPQHVMLRWRIPGRPERPEQRLPEYGELEQKKSVLGSVTFEVDTRVGGERDLTVTGFRNDKRVSGARAKVPWVRNGAQQLTLTLGCTDDLEDEDARQACSGTMDPDRMASAAPDAGASAPAMPDAELIHDVRADHPVDAAGKPADVAQDLRPVGATRDSEADPAPPTVALDAAAPDLRPPSGVELGRNLALYLRFDEGSPSLTTADGSGLGAGAALVDLPVTSAWIPGSKGNALRFPGDRPGWVRVSGPTLNNLTENFSLSVWIRSAHVPEGTNRRTIVARRSVGPGGFLYSLHLQGNRPALYINSSNGAAANFVSTQTLPPDQWVHLALVYDRKVARLWLDGRNIGEQSYMLNIPPENSPLCLGASEEATPTLATDPLGADLDELAIYDRALTADELAALARGAQPPFR
jgi:hypothetical protein